MCSYFNVGNKIFCFFEKRVFAFLDEGTFQGGGVNFSKILGGGGCSYRGGGGGGGGGVTV